MSQSENFPGGLWINGVRSTWPVALPLNVQPNPRKLQEPDSQLSRAQLPSTYSPWTSWRADNPGGTCTQLLGLVDSAPSMTSSLRPVANRTLLLVVGGAGPVVSTPNRRVSKCFSRNKPPGCSQDLFSGLHLTRRYLVGIGKVQHHL